MESDKLSKEGGEHITLCRELWPQETTAIRSTDWKVRFMTEIQILFKIYVPFDGNE